MKRPAAMLCSLLLSSFGCSADDESSAPATPTTGYAEFCAEYAEIAVSLSCSDAAGTESGCLSASDGLPEQCAELGLAWVRCAAEHSEDCYCESHNGHLNCEGTIKPSEGSAACLSEWDSYDACTAN